MNSIAEALNAENDKDLLCMHTRSGDMKLL